MDAEQWHRQATALVSRAPAPRRPDDLRSLGERDLAAYAYSVWSHLMGAAFVSPFHEQARLWLDIAVDSALAEPLGARTIVALCGDNTLGKSTLTKSWAIDRYRSWTGAEEGDPLPRFAPQPGIDAPYVPVAYLSLMYGARASALYSQVLGFTGHLTHHGGRRLVEMAIGALRTHGVRLVIVDDANLLHASTPAHGRETLDAIKHLGTELGELDGALVLVGAGLESGPVLHDPQIRGRLSQYQLHPYRGGTEAERGQWQRFLRNCESVVLPYLPDEEPGYLANVLGGYLWARTQGYVGDLRPLLARGVSQAITEKTRMTRDLLETIPLSQRATDGTPLPGAKQRKRRRQ